ncbi:MAG: hypothetical protein ACE5JR_09765 [Gemmatimonadota bacterium]
MSSYTKRSALVVAASLLAWGCASSDNPTALADLEPVVEFEIEAAEVETMEGVEVHAAVHEGGAPLRMTSAQLEIEPASGSPVRVVEMEPEGDGYGAHVRFFEPGEHHLRLLGQPERHNLMREMGEHEVHVFRQHRAIGPYWIEIGVRPARIIEGEEAVVRLYAFELVPDGTIGPPVNGLQMETSLHHPGGHETPLDFTEQEPGLYEAECLFAEAGVYELHVGIEGEEAEHSEEEEGEEYAEGEHWEEEHVDDGHDHEAEFHIVVLTESGDDVGGPEDGHGGDDHGHAH